MCFGGGGVKKAETIPSARFVYNQPVPDQRQRVIAANAARGQDTESLGSPTSPGTATLGGTQPT